ncbi:MAG: hypothetical protein M3Q23_13700 [Actinomycetota bacterium]|nr:hypothetical protein [Actinomycetota bacterium]
MRRATLIMLIALFLVLVGAAVVQAVLGGHDRAPCGPETPGGLPSAGSCVTPSPSAP